MEKTFALAETHFLNEGKTAIYHTLDTRVVMVIFLKKPEWPNREKEEVFRCPSCKGFVFSKATIRARGKDYKHYCKGSPRPALELREEAGGGKEVVTSEPPQKGIINDTGFPKTNQMDS